MCERQFVLLIKTGDTWKPFADSEGRPFVGNAEYCEFHQRYFISVKPKLLPRLGIAPVSQVSFDNIPKMETPKKSEETE